LVLQKLESRNAVLLKTNSLTDAQKTCGKRSSLRNSCQARRVGKRKLPMEKSDKY